MKLRPYQERAIADLRTSYAAGHRAPVLVLPTGGGKTVIAAAIVKGAIDRGNRVLFLAHRTELLDQTVRKLENAGITDVRMIRASSDLGSPTAKVTVASVQTLTRWAGRMPPAELVAFDECHHVVAETWQAIADNYRAARLLGLTATPQRADGRPLGDVFDSLVIGATARELTDLGHIVPCRIWAPFTKLETGELGMTPVEAYLRHAAGQRAVVFCATLEHARQTSEALNAAGVACGVVHGGLNALTRSDTLKRFESGELRAVCNVYVLTEGWDCPAASVCILAKKPKHAGTFLQMVGRVLRPAPGKTSALMLDLCGSVHDHGTPDCERDFTLDGKGIRQAGREPIRQCPTCGSVFISPSDGICPECGAAMPRAAIQSPHSIGVGLVDVGTAVPPRPTPTIAMTSKYPGRCAKCRGRISVGERIYWTKGSKPRHATCGSNDVLDEANRLLQAAN